VAHAIERESGNSSGRSGIDRFWIMRGSFPVGRHFPPRVAITDTTITPRRALRVKVRMRGRIGAAENRGGRGAGEGPSLRLGIRQLRLRRRGPTVSGFYVLTPACHRKLLRAARDLGLRLLTTLVTAVLVLGVLRAGSRYFYCEGTGTVRATSCCNEAHHGTEDGAQIEGRMDDCCKPRSVGYLPVGAIQTLPATPPAPFVAVLQNAASVPLKASIRRDAFGANFTGPPLLSASGHRARLMVFLI
jgi:hypothetical protein